MFPINEKKKKRFNIFIIIDNLSLIYIFFKIIFNRNNETGVAC